jgi:hypothetical protein
MSEEGRDRGQRETGRKGENMKSTTRGRRKEINRKWRRMRNR